MSPQTEEVKESDEEIINDALAYGWILEDVEEGYRLLSPPKHFKCCRWASIQIEKNYEGGVVRIPHFAVIRKTRRAGC